eukprot:1137914-Pelagomonas_calceolata.AAC.2
MTRVCLTSRVPFQQEDWRTSLKERKRKVAGHRPHALRKGPLTSKLARASPEETGDFEGGQ